MKRASVFAIFATVLLSALILCTNVQADITLNADLELDTSYTSSSDDDSDRNNPPADQEKDTTIYDSTGRIRIVPAVRKQTGSLYMEAKAEVLAKTDSTVTTDDVWAKIGTSRFDFQIGRFEAWDLFAKSNDMLIVDAPNSPARYETNYARGRFNVPGQMAVHLLPNETFGVEVAAVYGKDGTDNKIGLRPVVDIKVDRFELLAGLDYLKTTDQDEDVKDETDQFGYGGRFKVVLGMATLNLNYAHGVRSGKDASGDDLLDETTNSYGGLCDLALGRGILTLAAFYTTWEQEDNDFEKSQMQYYAAYAHPLPIEGATIKFGVSYATGTEETDSGDIDSDTLGFKVRLNYDF